MPHKIFMTYPREQGASSALETRRFLEREFGKGNVLSDVDIRADAKFPSMLEEHLAECKVMLVFIAPGWVDTQDAHGRRCLDDPNDRIRREIAAALKHRLEVIPMCIDGAQLPDKASLPDDIKRLLEHYPFYFTATDFRTENVIARTTHPFNQRSSPASAMGIENNRRLYCSCYRCRRGIDRLFRRIIRLRRLPILRWRGARRRPPGTCHFQYHSVP